MSYSTVRYCDRGQEELTPQRHGLMGDAGHVSCSLQAEIGLRLRLRVQVRVRVKVRVRVRIRVQFKVRLRVRDRVWV